VGPEHRNGDVRSGCWTADWRSAESINAISAYRNLNVLVEAGVARIVVGQDLLPRFDPLLSYVPAFGLVESPP